MIKIVNKKFIDMGHEGLQHLVLSLYENRKYALINTNPIYNGRRGIAVAYPGRELDFFLEEIAFSMKSILTGKGIH